MKRRYFIIDGLKLVSIASFGTLLINLKLTNNIFGKTWLDLVKNLSPTGELQVLRIIGEAINGNKLIETNAIFKGNNAFLTKDNSQIILNLPDNSLLWAGKNCRFDLFPTKNNGLVISLIKGEIMVLTNQMNKNFYPILIHTNNADYGLRNGIFYSKILDSSDNSDFLEYSCLCNGLCDITSKNYQRTTQTILGKNHNSFYLKDVGDYEQQQQQVDIKYHSNDLIKEIAKYFVDGGHSLGWIDES